jgi:hypothetical protein
MFAVNSKLVPNHALLFCGKTNAAIAQIEKKSEACQDTWFQQL